MLMIISTLILVAISYFISSKMKSRNNNKNNNSKLIGFLHPASGAGGGGERVLWVAIEHILKTTPESTHVALYTTEFPSPATSTSSSNDHLLCTLVPKQFGITSIGTDPQLRARLHIHYIPLQWLQDPNLYPVARLLLQSLVGGIALAVGVLYNIFFVDTTSPVPSLLIDSVGIPFSYIWLRAAFFFLYFFNKNAVRIGCYVHYPYISTDMIDSVSTERVMPNNPQPATGWKKQLKLNYYYVMVMLYRWAAGFLVNGPVACNSTWTRNHIKKVWGPVFVSGGGGAGGEPQQQQQQIDKKIQLLFPPVNVERFKQFDLESRFENSNREILLISVGQFRPEKNHPLLLRSFSRALKALESSSNIKLKIIGGARNEEDKQRAEDLKKLTTTLEGLKLDMNVEFCLNAPFSDLEDAFRKASIGLHTMRDEHFGIVVVEYMASGCITIAHNSAGPAEIVSKNNDGYLCETEEEYANAIVAVIQKIQHNNERENLKQMQVRARQASGRFGDAGFGESFEKMFM